MRIWTTLALMMLSIGVFAACSDDGGGRTGYFNGNRLVAVPPGGDDLGALDPLTAISRESVIDNPNEVHGYPLSFVSDGLMMASVEGSGGLDPFLELYDEFGVRVTGDDNGSFGRDALLVGVVPAGSYTLLVWPSPESQTTGGYRLNVFAGTTGGEDFIQITPGEMVEPLRAYTLASDGDVHTFALSLSDATFVSFEAMASAGMADMGLRLLDQRGDQIFWENPPGLSDPTRTSVSLEAGNYILTVENGEFAEGGEYTIRITAAQ